MAERKLRKHPLILRAIVSVFLAMLLGSCAGLRTKDGAETPDQLSTASANALKATEVDQGPTEISPAGMSAPAPAITAAPPMPAYAYVLPQVPSTSTFPPAVVLEPTPGVHPMDIEGMREREYPGSEITLHEELERGANYSRYYASYESDGLTIYGLLTIPDGEMPPTGWPAIVFNHGYIPPDVYRTTERYIAYVDALARSQYIVFRIDYRGHDQSEGEASGAYGDPGYTIDVLNALASLKRFPQVDPQRIGMWGHSMGGFLTLRAMVISPDIKAGVIWAGVVGSYPDLLARWRRGGSSTATPVPASGSRRWRDAWAAEYGAPDENPKFWAGLSANSFLNEISGPVQLHHGTMDEEVPIILSGLLYEQLLAENKTVEFFAYEDDNHNISNSFSEAMTRTIFFFDKYLKDGSQQ